MLVSLVSISYDKFKSVHPVTEKEDNDVLEDIEYSSSDDSEDGTIHKFE